MKKKWDVKNKNQSSTIEEEVDLLLAGLEKTPKKTTKKDFDAAKWSPKKRVGEAIYYLREKPKRQTKELSDEIITAERQNLGKKPLPQKETKEEPIKRKKKIRFGKRKEKTVDTNLDEKPVKETIDEPSKNGELVDEIDQFLDDKEPASHNDKIIDKIDNLADEKKNTADDKEVVLVTEQDILQQDIEEEIIIPPEEKEEEKRKKEKEVEKVIKDSVEKPTEETQVEPSEDKKIISEIDQFLDDKEPASHNDKIIDKIDNPVDEKKNTADDKEVVLVTEQDILQQDIEEEIIIPPEEKKAEEEPAEGAPKAEEPPKAEAAGAETNEAPTEQRPHVEAPQEEKPEETTEPEEPIEEQPAAELPKEEPPVEEPPQEEKPTKRKLRFKKSKSPENKEVIKKKEEEIDADDLINRLGFRVENLPASSDISEDEVKLVDDKIKETPKPAKQDMSEKVLEQQAKTFAKEHLKEKISAEPESAIKEKEEDDHEHVFFDEMEASFTGWSPQITEEEREGVSTPLDAEPEIKKDDIELPKDVLQTKSIKLTDLGFSENDWEELEFYPLLEPFAYVEILREKESLDKRYFLVEVGLTPEEQRTLDFILETMGRSTIDTLDLEAAGDDKYLMKEVQQVLKDYDIKLNTASRSKILYYLEKNSLGLGKIDPLMRDPNIEDISCDGAKVPLFLYHRQYGSLKSNIEFKGEEELSSFVHKLAQKCGKHISIAEPMLDATMPDGSRIQMTLSDEITAKGSTFTIRKFREDPFSPPDLIELNTMSAEMLAYFWMAVENGINALIAGGTASGKTTVLNALSLFIPREAKIVSIEETREINLPHPNWIPGVARSGFGEIIADKMVGEIDMYDLMKAALRQRPEYIIVGEIRGREAYVLFQAMATGHATYSTVHADSAQSLIHRLEGKPINIPRVMLQSLDVVSLHVIARVKNKRARRCKQIIEVIDIDPTTKEILTNEVFRWDPVEDKFIYSGKSYVLERIRAEKDLSREEMTEEIKNRAAIVEWMNEKNVREFREVAKIVSRYGEEPEEVLKQIRKGAKS